MTKFSKVLLLTAGLLIISPEVYGGQSVIEKIEQLRLERKKYEEQLRLERKKYDKFAERMGIDNVYPTHRRDQLVQRALNNPDLFTAFQLLKENKIDVWLIRGDEHSYSLGGGIYIVIGYEASDDSIIEFICGETPCQE